MAPVKTGIGRASIEVFKEGDITLPFPELITSRATFTAANGDKIFRQVKATCRHLLLIQYFFF
jgi:hypothetical protein